MTAGQGQGFQVNEITNNGDTAVNVTVPNAAQLSGLDSLYVVNPSNSGFGAEYNANLGDISAAVNDGMNLIIFDRRVAGAETILPGGGGIIAVRNFASGTDVNVAAGAPASFTNGPNGPITDATLDGGNFSNHGFVELTSLPPGAVPLLTTSDPTHIVAFTYPFGQGNVFYSTIPLDFYSNQNNPAITPAEINTLFGNVLETICFTRGALIRTVRGPVPIESLSVGDEVVVRRGGSRPIRWIGSTKFNRVDLTNAPNLFPVRICAGALGDGLPAADLLVSRQHRVLVSSAIAQSMFGQSEILIAAIKLTKLAGIYVDDTVEDVEYFHILFDDHEIVWAENTPTESLSTAPLALAALSRSARAEIFGLFPELAKHDYTHTFAALVPSNADQKRLVANHAQSHLALVSQTGHESQMQERA